MIITHNHMIGLPVIDVENGFRAGYVEDLIVNASEKVVEAVIKRWHIRQAQDNRPQKHS